MSGQPDLFDTAPYQAHRDTSRAAAEEIRASMNSLQAKVYWFIYRCGGLTDEEIQDGLDMNPSTQRPRRIELMDMGKIKDSGQTRRTKSGRRAVVWRVT